MTRRVIILRPQPGADATESAARAMGLETLLYPLFEIAPLGWPAPEPDAFDALMLTSANAARHAGPDLMRYAALPLYVVGEATAKAAHAVSLEPAHIGARDAAALVEDMRRAGVRRALHLCGADVVAAAVEGVSIRRIPVYHAREAGDADSLAAQLRADDICLVHSPRAGARLAALVPPEQRANVSLIAISGSALTAAGTGWADALAAPAPTDPAMLALAQELCHKPGDAARRR
ncbi:uroporphyrinogen-III synthase [Sphingobium sp. DEHP117]|uniref:uroporphyrinogen-III synthase n=1 Tax=Sphingobium sp. DEHP117 TaxID=2993436 RepID=UPI0027D5B7B3|nr:uroporphyrinogen-III synthase [Sphingobium sp. DEHP117]MDQ4420418.1 uroporphyrinogen-III synthase [Sphingobium sp. DEHP117]